MRNFEFRISDCELGVIGVNRSNSALQIRNSKFDIRNFLYSSLLVGLLRYLIITRLVPSSVGWNRTSSINARMICNPRPRVPLSDPAGAVAPEPLSIGPMLL